MKEGGDCKHYDVSRVIDKLGMMRADSTGRVSAPVLESHWECFDCEQVLEVRARSDEEPADAGWIATREIRKDYSFELPGVVRVTADGMQDVLRRVRRMLR